MSIEARYTGQTPHLVPSSTRFAIRRRLLSWYDEFKRDLPWRHRARDPYAQWVAEIMLQQTRVDTVIRYYEPFLDRFPDIASLARADHEEVLKRWEGLGYYRRVLNLHRAARLLIEQGADIPSTSEGLRRLSGVGEYTAAAIASIVHGEPAAAVDGNVIRVVARLFQINADTLAHAGKRQIAERARQLIPADRPGDFNQAWMDLASLVCLPRNPRCDECPLSGSCGAFRNATTERFPVRGTGRAAVVPIVRVVVALIVHRSRILMRKRPEGGLWSGLWEPPQSEYSERGRAAAVRRLLADHGLHANSDPRPLAELEHRLTHRRLLMRPVLVAIAGKAPTGDKTRARWVSRAGLDGLPIPTAFRKVLRAADW